MISRPASARPTLVEWPVFVLAVGVLVLTVITYFFPPDWEGLGRFLPDPLDPMADAQVGPRQLVFASIPAAGFFGVFVGIPVWLWSGTVVASRLRRASDPGLLGLGLALIWLVTAIIAFWVNPSFGLLTLTIAFAGGAGTGTFLRTLSPLLLTVLVGASYLFLTGDYEALAAEFPLRSGATESILYVVLATAIIFTVALLVRARPVPIGPAGSRVHQLSASLRWVAWALGALVAVVGVLSIHASVGSPPTLLPIPDQPGRVLLIAAIVAVPAILLLAVGLAAVADIEQGLRSRTGPDAWRSPLAMSRAAARVALIGGPLVYGAWLGLFAAPEPASSQIRDRDGYALGVRYEPPTEPGIAIPLALPARAPVGDETDNDADVIPLFLYEALVATEDIGADAGSAHPGVQPVSVARVLAQAASGAGGASGGSGIAAQVVKRETGRPITAMLSQLHPLLGAVGTMIDKLMVEFPAAWTYQAVSDLSPSDQDPLTVWLNNVELGNLTRGVRAAAWVYFGTRLNELTVAQGATLIALANAPSALDPYEYPDDLLERRNAILGWMGDQGYLTAEEVEIAQGEGLTGLDAQPYRPNEMPFQTNGLIELAMTESERAGLTGVSRAGRTYQVTLDPSSQAQLDLAVDVAVAEAVPFGVTDGAAIVLIPETGEVLALDPGRTFDDGEGAAPNMMTTIPHQPGSAIKPLVYACALDMGILEPDGLVPDDRSTGQRLGVADWDNLYASKPIPWQEALFGSRNIPAAWLAEQMGPVELADCLRSRFGITHNLQPETYGVRIGIGLAPMPLIQLADAYGVLALDGMDLPVTAILSVEDRHGDEIWDANTDAERTLRCGPAALVAEAMRPITTMNYGLTGWSSKTGTTEQSSVIAAWSPDLVVVAWLGNSEPGTGTPRAIDQASIGNAAARVLTEYTAGLGLTEVAPVTGCLVPNAVADGSFESEVISMAARRVTGERRMRLRRRDEHRSLRTAERVAHWASDSAEARPQRSPRIPAGSSREPESTVSGASRRGRAASGGSAPRCPG